jgi:hypothetical protein
MATHDFTNGSITGQPKPMATLPNTTGMFCRSNIVDFANENLDAGDGETAALIAVPADTWVIGVALRVITAEGANGTIDLGITGGDVDCWGDALSLASTGNVVTLYSPQYFAAAGSIDALATTDGADVDIDGAKIEVVAMMVPGNKTDYDGKSEQST